MSAPVILVVTGDPALAGALAQALARHGLPRPIHVTSGEEAVLWVGGHACDCGVLGYDLPGIDGLETLRRLRQRKPDLPAILVSGARSEAAAIAAFHARVVDYVPAGPGCAATVAQRVAEVLRHGAAADPAPATVDAAIPTGLFRPTYGNRLRVIGRQLDLYGYRALNLSEVGGGFLARALPPAGRTPEALEFADRDFPQSVAAALAARGEGEHRRAVGPLLPTGYEDVLRALGHALDARQAEAITITELDAFVVVAGVGQADGEGAHALAPFQQLLRQDDITTLLDAAFRRRVKATSPSRLGRLLGR